MSDWTPNTEQVRDAYVRAMRNAFIASAGEHRQEFDRWLATIQAAAFDHGVQSWGKLMIRRSELNNPYRRQENNDE
jgi:hypothetical protein